MSQREKTVRSTRGKWAKYTNRILTKAEIQFIYNYLELCSSSLGLKKMHNKTAMNDAFCPSNEQKAFIISLNYNI